ncbi:hypothetical protein [Nocardia arizonensis]|uniref:hypothetical protein n=1 Tax=Nocardia arizonensis TaxID=1141647 RepID=UPI0006D06B62|nr:hypothetical protein [Nocardia arizonensis]
MEHGQRDAESIGAILSGIARILREVSDKLDAVAARVDAEGADDGSLAVRLAKIEAWAFRTEQHVAALDTRLESVTSGAVRAPAPSEPAPPRAPDPVAPPAARAPRADVGTRPQPPTRAERRELAERAEQDLPTRTENPLPVRDTSAAATARERRLPRAAANRGERAETPAGAHAESAEQVVASAQEATAERLMPPVPPALHDWVEPPASDPAPRVEAQAADTFTPRYEPVPVADTAPAGPLGMDYGRRAERLDTPTSPNGRVEISAPNLNGRADSGLTAAHTEPETNGAHRPTIEDNAHVDKLQAMLDELKRNPNGPFGRPLGAAGEMPA